MPEIIARNPGNGHNRTASPGGLLHIDQPYLPMRPGITFDEYVWLARPMSRSVLSRADRSKWQNEVKLPFEKTITRLLIITKVHLQASRVEVDARTECLKTLVIENMRQFSKSKQRKAAIRAWVMTNYPENIGDSFSLGIPTCVLNLTLHWANSSARHPEMEGEKPARIQGQAQSTSSPPGQDLKEQCKSRIVEAASSSSNCNRLHATA
jgi:hypothetical protein